MVMNHEFEFIDLMFLQKFLRWAKESTPLRTISKQKRAQLIAAGTYVTPQPKNLLQRLCYLFSKGALETFFKDAQLNELFRHFFPQIRDAIYISEDGEHREEVQEDYSEEIETLNEIALFIKEKTEQVNQSDFRPEINAAVDLD